MLMLLTKLHTSDLWCVFTPALDIYTYLNLLTVTAAHTIFISMLSFNCVPTIFIFVHLKHRYVEIGLLCNHGIMLL